jgi:hypothetical protein
LFFIRFAKSENRRAEHVLLAGRSIAVGGKKRRGKGYKR